MSNFITLNKQEPGTRIKRIINIDHIAHVSYDDYQAVIHFINGETIELSQHWSYMIWKKLQDRSHEISDKEYSTEYNKRELEKETYYREYEEMLKKEEMLKN